MASIFDFYGESALISRLTRALQKRCQEVVFLVGSPLSAATIPGGFGVPSVDGIIAMIREEFLGDPEELRQFDLEIQSAAERKYQAAFRFLQGNRGQPVANEIVRRAVLQARLHRSSTENLTDAGCRLIESELAAWSLSPSTNALGKLVTEYPATFGRAILTTNFDPLIEVAIRRAGGQLFRTTLHADGDLHQTEGDGCHVIHLHGYWYNSDTLNTTRQLTQERPRLKASLTSLLKDRLLVVCGYGGWDDVFTSTLLDLVRDDSAGPEVLWTFRGEHPKVPATLASQLAPGIDRGRVLLYQDIDCNSILPKLLDAWHKLSEPAPPAPFSKSNPVHITSQLKEAMTQDDTRKRVLEGDDEDRPPLVDFCLGREYELKAISDSTARVMFITGIGGQGKSTLAAKYFAEAQSLRSFEYFLWRDCKEEGERFENQIASVIETLSGGVLAGTFLAKQSIEALIEILSDRLGSLSVLFVFDNVDHYVNLETGRLTSGANLFIQLLLSAPTQSKVVFTCRPLVRYEDEHSHSIKLDGISQVTALDLFEKRRAVSTPEEIARAHQLTNGHAFWLDLLALQIANRVPSPSLTELLNKIDEGDGELPSVTLQSIWTSLKENERTVLRLMAETVRPETEAELGDYLRAEMNYNRLTKALRSLRTQNLIVRKQASNGSSLLELHPIVRQFVRTSFTRVERSPSINAIIEVYKRVMAKYREQLKLRPTFTILQNWTQAAELEIEADRIQEAILVLADSLAAFRSSAFSREFSRAVRLLLSSFDWPKDGSKYKMFDLVFKQHIRTLSYLGEYEEADQQLDKFGQALLERDARYIFYCEMRCYSEWNRGDFSCAVDWGSKGRTITEETGVDTQIDISHTLALAERDAGRPEVALPVFTGGRSLADVIDPDELDEKRAGAYYGNIGRCLHFMGRVNEALICYQKSALLIEKNLGDEHLMNQGFIRCWIGELLISRKQEKLGMVFLEAARQKWEVISPPRMKQIEDFQEQLDETLLSASRKDNDVEKTCRDWIMGRYLDGKV